MSNEWSKLHIFTSDDCFTIPQIKSKFHLEATSFQIHLKGDQCGCVEEVNNEGEIEIDRPNECPQDDQDPENPGDIQHWRKIMPNDLYHICIN